ncbi:MAG: hypothetical protein EB127_06035 [Alphaproteobacteria bacterium]|nr:hypothetical protein [Alphaproteobacteria bacterium]
MTEVSLLPNQFARQWIEDHYVCAGSSGANLLQLAEDGVISWEIIARAYIYDADETASHNAQVRVAEWSAYVPVDYALQHPH